MVNLIDFEDPERLRVYESLSDFHKLKNSLMFRLYQEHVSNINIPHSYNGEQLCSQNELNEEFLKWLNTSPYNKVDDAIQGFKGECSSFAEHIIGIDIPYDISSWTVVQRGEYSENDLVVYYSLAQQKAVHFGVLKFSDDNGWRVWSKFGLEWPIFEHGIHSVPSWYGVAFAVKRPPG